MNRSLKLFRNAVMLATALVAAPSFADQDIMSLGTVNAMQGTTVVVPVYIRDASGTALGADQSTSARIQAVGLRVSFSPSASVKNATFRRAGITSAKTPLYERSMQAQNGAPTGYVMSFALATNPLAFTLNGPAGDVVGELVVTLAPNAPAGLLSIPIDSTSAALSNQAGTLMETPGNGKLIVYAGGINVMVPHVRSDFNADGRSDIVLQNTNTSAVAVWLMNDNAILEGKVIATPGAEWQIAASGDLDGDGKADVVVKNNTTGALAFWKMNGSALASITTIATPSIAWRVVGTRDFNHDGRDDLVMQNSSTGAVAVWQMNGAAVQSGVVVTTDTASNAVALGNFGGDAIVFESKSDQSLYRAVVVNNAVTATNPIANAAGTSVVMAGDFDGDGDDDLALQTTATRTVSVQLLAADGFSVTSSAAVATPVAEWHVVGGADYDGNGRADLLLHNPPTNGIAQWQMNGATIARGWNIATMPGWKPLGN
ncbi:MAG: repeat protein [Acidobacteria bacterium]|nr:repeat protein [Acidobacteriota bacterium]